MLAIALLAPSAGGCASIIRGGSTDFTIETTPPGAQATLSTGETCEATPCTFEKKRKQPFTVTVSMAGYQTTTHEIGNQWSRNSAGYIVGNALVCCGLIGFGVDAATGAYHDLTPNPLQVTMQPEGQPAVAAHDAAPAGAPPTEAAPAAEAAAPPSQ